MGRNAKTPTPSFSLHSFNEMLRFCRDTFGDRPAFSYRINKEETETVTFHAFYLDVLRLSGSFSRFGLS